MPEYTVELISQEALTDGECRAERTKFEGSPRAVSFRSVNIKITPTAGNRVMLQISTADGRDRTFTVGIGSVLRVPYFVPAGRGIIEIHLV